MKKLNLNIDLSELKLGEVDKEKSDIELCTHVIKNVVLNWGISNNRRGLCEEDRRRFYKISDVFDKAVKDKTADIELEDDWMGLIRKCFRECELMPDKLLRQVEEKINEVKDR